MLKVLFGRELENCNSHPSVYFDNVYEYEWCNDQVVIKMVKDIDSVCKKNNITYLKDRYLEN